MVEGIVDLYGVEVVFAVGEPFSGGQSLRIEEPLPVPVTPTGGADKKLRHLSFG
jgi:hypothetical protein